MVDADPPNENDNNDRNSPPRAGRTWTDDERRKLIQMVHQGHNWAEIAEHLGRSVRAVMIEFARVVEEGDLVEINPKFPTEELQSRPPKDTGRPPKNSGFDPIMNPGDRRDLEKYNVTKDSDGTLWYSFYIDRQSRS
tara:strand:+ start:110 stop:520 length:411 start_codon:yes stop_codon:yes gene_type:complete